MKKADATRLTILKKAYDLIYASGYQVTSIDDIIATTKVTKGAFYYHFKTKDDMGLAIVNEILGPVKDEDYFPGAGDAGDPNKFLYGLMNHLLFGDSSLLLKYGCPISNLTQEMTPWHKGFTKALAALNLRWQNSMITVIKDGIKSGYYRKNVNAEQVINFIIAGYWGVRNLGKLTNSADCYRIYLKELKNYLDSLRMIS